MPCGIVFHDLPGKNEGAKRCSILCECVPAATGKQKTHEKTMLFQGFYDDVGEGRAQPFSKLPKPPNEIVTVPSKNLALRRGF